MPTIPRSITELSAYVESLGGTVTRTRGTEESGRYEFTVPVRYRVYNTQELVVRQLNIGSAGYFTQANGRPLVSGVARTYRAIELRAKTIPGYASPLG